jgi:UTP:GlnB (protein PII) uridylyltransferase
LEDIFTTIDIELVGSETDVFSQASSSLPNAITDVFNLQSGTSTSDSVSVVMDNTLSPAHTLVQIMCQDHKGLLFDIMRTLKDFNIQV